MTDSVATISYAQPVMHSCPLCRQRPVVAKTIYGHPVCKKCFYAFANRRQLGYLVDALIIIIPNVIITMGAMHVLLSVIGLSETVAGFALLPVSALLMCVFIMKDGFNGGSPGKKLCGTQVLDDATGQPIGFGQSFKRNSILLVGLIPFVGGIASLVVIIGLAVQVAKGYRWGDRFAGTRVIWKKYANLAVFGGNALICEQCGYELVGNVSGTCPECGTPVSEHNRQRLADTPPVSPAPAGLTS